MSYDLPSYEGWDCPTCMRPMEKEDDHECNTCGLNASEHLSVTSLCRILREVSGREAALIVERDKLKRMLELQQKISVEAVIELEARTAQRDAEHALADRLHGALDALGYNLAFAGNTLIGGLRERVTAMRAIALPALTAWKEARSEV